MNVDQFLQCETPDEWLQAAIDNLDILLIDHANCEKKAASTALNLMFRYDDKPDLMMRLSKLAREELRHYEQVMSLIKQRQIQFRHISSANYAAKMRAGLSTYEPARLVDLLIVCAIVEARSCERFQRLVTVMDEELASFYTSLLKSEARHFKMYLGFAETISGTDIGERVEFFLAKDKQLIQAPSAEFRFHSGPLKADH